MRNMKTLNEIRDILAQHKEELEQKHKVKEMGIFGSYVRGQQRKRGDLDILVEFEEPIGLFEFMNLERYLTELVGGKVDLVMKTALKPRIGRRIMEEVEYI